MLTRELRTVFVTFVDSKTPRERQIHLALRLLYQHRPSAKPQTNVTLMKKILAVLTFASAVSFTALADDGTNSVVTTTAPSTASTPKSIILVGSSTTSTASTTTSAAGTAKSTTVLQDSRDNKSWDHNRDNDTTLTGN
jgi:hypothetical protein